MAKAHYERNRLHDNQMKQIIIRLDYTGVRDGADLVKLFDRRFPKVFRRSQDIYNNEFTLSFRKEDLPLHGGGFFMHRFPGKVP